MHVIFPQGSENMEVKSEEFSSDRLELTVGVKTSKREMSLGLATRHTEEGSEGGRWVTARDQSCLKGTENGKPPFYPGYVD